MDHTLIDAALDRQAPAGADLSAVDDGDAPVEWWCPECGDRDDDAAWKATEIQPTIPYAKRCPDCFALVSSPHRLRNTEALDG